MLLWAPAWLWGRTAPFKLSLALLQAPHAPGPVAGTPPLGRSLAEGLMVSPCTGTCGSHAHSRGSTRPSMLPSV